MKLQYPVKTVLFVAAGLSLAACSPRPSGTTAAPTSSAIVTDQGIVANNRETAPQNYERSSIWDIFGPNAQGEQTGQVNRYLWAASLDVLNFLPVESVDPFTGVINTGYGRPPGGGQTYRATVHISDPALDARSLSVSLQTSGGRPVSAATNRAVEDAILSRARQLRIADDAL
ncbi:DUF3576 domain-containing protein [Lutimaribacter marinistellae]|uniref:DUF3576 domain-containing protein n=1 Tax=Lutimaribacter marinistellae TaxID=1820329 RepID=A0ABV7TH64_9RHOB